MGESKLTVKIEADTTELETALSRIQTRLQWIHEHEARYSDVIVYRMDNYGEPEVLATAKVRPRATFMPPFERCFAVLAQTADSQEARAFATEKAAELRERDTPTIPGALYAKAE